MRLKITLLVLFGYYVQFSQSARILGVVPTPSFSHQVVFRPLWRELSLRGHQVTVLTTDPMKDPSLTNLTEIDLHFTYKLWNENVLDLINSNQESPVNLVTKATDTLNEILEQQLEHPPVQALIKSKTEHFDLLIVEFMLPTMYAFAARFNCPLIGMTSLDAPSISYEAIGNPSHPVTNPNFMLPFAGELNFIERVVSTLFNAGMELYGVYSLRIQQETVKKYFGEDYPLLWDIATNISMLFVNANPIFFPVRPLLPNVIQIGGGTHRRASKPLPKDLKKKLDDATQGFIYFSLGTNVKSKDLSESTLKILLETFADLPYLILWKFELEHLPGQPKNVVISKWFPQQDIFQHPNIKLFITQGGLQSMEEAVYEYVPMVGIPFFGDQPANVNRLVAKGMGLSLDPQNLDKKTAKKTIVEVINNPKYRNRVKQLVNLAKDQPMTGLEKAVWWTEYVLRHKGAKHLRSPALDIPFYQYFLLDVMGFCLLVILITGYLLVKLIQLPCKLVKYFTSKPKVKIQ